MFAGLVSQSFDLSDQPNFGTWYIRVDAFVSITILTLLLQAQFMRNFFKNTHVFLYLVCWSLVFQIDSGIQRFHYVHIYAWRICNYIVTVTTVMRSYGLHKLTWIFFLHALQMCTCTPTHTHTTSYTHAVHVRTHTPSLKDVFKTCDVICNSLNSLTEQ